MTETREEFLIRVDSNDTPHEQALFVAIQYLQLIADDLGSPVRMALSGLESIDKRLGGEG